jgi:ABC-type multidrug transport system fused ATPase/permease subunit
MVFALAPVVGSLMSEGFWTALFALILYGVAPGFLAYIAGYGIWALKVIARYIQWLTPVFELDIQPEHGDRCGGLKGLGDLCFEIAAMIVVPTSVFGLYVLLGHVEPTLSVWSLVVVIALVTALIVAALSFFRPLLGIHRSMVEARERLLDEAISSITPVKARLRELVASGRFEEQETHELRKQLEVLRQLYPADLRHPTWPFTMGIILAFYASQTVPVVSLIVGIIELARLFRP